MQLSNSSCSTAQYRFGWRWRPSSRLALGADRERGRRGGVSWLLAILAALGLGPHWPWPWPCLLSISMGYNYMGIYYILLLLY